jgi:hypothetical protein
VLPGRPLLERETGAQRCDFLGRPLRLRQISFPDASAWNQFGVLAVLAIQHAFPAALDAALRITRALPRSARTAPDDRAATHTPRPSMPTSEAPKAAA